MTKFIKELSSKVREIADKYEDEDAPDIDYEKVENIKQEIEWAIESLCSRLDIEESEDLEELERMQRKIEILEKKREDFIEGIYDDMFPNRHDDDFDEDSMSYDGVFGDD